VHTESKCEMVPSYAISARGRKLTQGPPASSVSWKVNRMHCIVRLEVHNECNIMELGNRI
jgi:hypothetical protein